MAVGDWNVFVTRRIPEPGIDILRQHCKQVEVNPEDRVLTRAELLEKVHGRDGLLTLLTDKIDAEVMDAAGPRCRVIANYAVGFDNIDLAAATERGIMVTNTPGVLTDATAEHAWALLFAVARRVVQADGFTRAGEYKGWAPMLFLGADVTGATLGVVGAGRIGTAVALKSAGFGMKVIYTDAVDNATLDRELGARRVSMDELLQEADFISLHVPLTPETHHLFDAAAFRKMKKTAYLINTSRGPVIDEAALVQALKNGDIAGAALDVFEEEPKIHPELLDLDNVVLTPHIASATINARTKMATTAAENLVAALEGRRPPNLLNPEVVDKVRA
jgi:D-3-phosphoglycerate dehydrogenase